MAERLAGGNAAIALLGNAIPTGAILFVLITMLGPISGAHFNPAVTLAFVLRREVTSLVALAYVVVQIIGGVTGTLTAHAMFEETLIQFSTQLRNGPAQWFSESVATFGLVATILATRRWRPEAVAERRWAVYHSRLLVYRLHFLCQPGSDHRQKPDRHFQWNLAGEHASLYCGPVGRGGDRNCSDRLAAAL